MSREEWEAMERCPKCDYPVFKNRKTGLIGCMAPQIYKCGWHYRATPITKKKK